MSASRSGILEKKMTRPYTLLFAALLLVTSFGRAQDRPAAEQAEIPSTYVPSGEDVYKQFCAACHGTDAKGHGPAASSLKTPPPDLTTLAERHGGGKFPYAYLSAVLLFGPGVSTHGSAEMPTSGHIFYFRNRQMERVVQQRIKKLADYLVTLQEK